jgi:hypothetical protein
MAVSSHITKTAKSKESRAYAFPLMPSTQSHRPFDATRGMQIQVQFQLDTARGTRPVTKTQGVYTLINTRSISRNENEYADASHDI